MIDINLTLIRAGIAAVLVPTLLLLSDDSVAWSTDGHTAIGILAMSQLEPQARRQLESFIGPLDEQAMIRACNWPDDVREDKEWEWSAPQHYINIPRGDYQYEQGRDCSEQMCATEAIKKYAGELADANMDTDRRWQAFAWLCHVTGDLHQPMHAGFEDDRGGNRIEIIFNNEPVNLHEFWDYELINAWAGDWENLVYMLSRHGLDQAGNNWSENMVDDWTNASHELAKTQAYPIDWVVTQAFQQQSWELVKQQISMAATHLALIINTQLGDQD